MRTDPITPAEIAVLNAARLILADLAKFDTNGTPLQCYAAAFADVAGTAMFNYLNTANAFLDVGMTYEQLHNRPKPAPEPTPEPTPEP